MRSVSKDKKRHEDVLGEGSKCDLVHEECG